jgi:hypothetical protein
LDSDKDVKWYVGAAHVVIAEQVHVIIIGLGSLLGRGGLAAGGCT